MAEVLVASVSRGVRASILAQVVKFVVQLVSLAVLARLLDPVSFGLVAMAVLVIGFAELFRDAGLSSAALRVPDLTRAQRDNLFWINTGIGAVLALTFAASAPAIAAGFGHDQLVGICLGLAPTFLWSGMATQFRVHLLRDMRVRRLALCEVAGVVLALLIAVGGALLGLGYWALVLQQSLGGLLGLLLLVIASGWLPCRWRRGTGTRPIVRLGARFLGASLLAYVDTNLDSILVGRLLGAQSLGLYNRSLQLVRVPLRQLQAPYISIALPVLSRLLDDPPRFIGFVNRLQVSLAYPVLLGAAVVVAAHDEVVRLALGSQWTGASGVLAWLAAGNALATSSMAASSIYLAKGMGRELQRFGLVNTCVVVVCLLVGTAGGLTGIAAGYAVSVAVCWPLTFLFLRRATGLALGRLVASALRALMVAVIAGSTASATTHLVQESDARVSLALAVLTVLCVAALSALVRPVRHDYRVLADTAARVLAE